MKFKEKKLTMNHNLPTRTNSVLIGRNQEIKQIMDALLPYPHSRFPLVQIVGLGGVGKSTLALEIAYRYMELGTFDSIIWINQNRFILTNSGINRTQPQGEPLSEILNTISIVLNMPNFTTLNFDSQLEAIQTQLGKSRNLIILDDFEELTSAKTLDFLSNLPSPSKSLITSRQPLPSAYTIKLAGLSTEASQLLVDSEATRKNLKLTPEKKLKIAEMTKGIPLAIIWFVGQLSLGHSLVQLSKSLDKNTITEKNLIHIIFDKTIEKIKSRPSYNILLSLALLGGVGNIQAIKFITSLSDSDRDNGLGELLELSLINRKQDGFELSYLTKEYVEELIKEESLETLTYFLSQTPINKRDQIDSKFDVFLAHNSKDKTAVQAISKELKKRKIKPWVDTEQILSTLDDEAAYDLLEWGVTGIKPKNLLLED